MRRSGFLLLALCAACSNPESQRLENTTKASYDPASGRLKELTYDANKNGRIDTWTEMDGARPVRARIDRDEDGRLDRWEYYGEKGELTKVGFSRAGTGVPDAWAFAGPDGRIVRVEASSAADEHKIDRWERYRPTAAEGLGELLAVEEDGNRDGRPDKWETYAAGTLKTVSFDEDRDGRPDRRLTYAAGALSAIETEPDSSGKYGRLVRVK